MEQLLRETELAPAPEPKKSRFGLKPHLGGKKRWKKWAALGLVVILAGGWLFLRGKSSQQAAAAVTYQEAAVETRDIVNSLTSSGTLQPADSYTVSTLVSGEILSDTFEEGDQVEEGATLYVLDASSVENSLTQAQRNYESARKAKYPEATMSGTVAEVYVKNGDSVNSGTELCRIVGDNNIYMDFLFSYASADDFYVGQSATIFINGFDGSVSGTVEKVSTSSTASGNAANNSMMMTTVRVKAVNPGLVTEGYSASAVIGSYSSYGTVAVNLSGAAVVTASGSGTVSGLNLLAGDLIQSGDRICTITGDSVDDQLESARLNLENAQDNVDDYEITAPISGEVVTKNAKAGDTIEGSASSSLCTIYDLSYLEMTMNIDELDISQVAVGQSVTVTADAVEGTTYTGVVTRVSVAGTTSGGITTYPVTVRIDETDGLLPGMNVDAEIVIESRSNALAVPSAAVNRGNTVLVTADSPSAANALEQEAPEGYVYVPVEIGVSDDSYTEILSGLQEGDTVAYLGGSTQSSGMMAGGMMAGMDMGGGMPGGGMPSGGGPMP